MRKFFVPLTVQYFSKNQNAIDHPHSENDKNSTSNQQTDQQFVNPSLVVTNSMESQRNANIKSDGIECIEIVFVFILIRLSYYHYAMYFQTKPTRIRSNSNTSYTSTSTWSICYLWSSSRRRSSLFFDYLFQWYSMSWSELSTICIQCIASMSNDNIESQSWFDGKNSIDEWREN